VWYRVDYPYQDAGTVDTTAFVTDPTYFPQNTWLGGSIGTIFGDAPNATAVLLVVNVSALPLTASHFALEMLWHMSCSPAHLAAA
jgi:hypothetical protein